MSVGVNEYPSKVYLGHVLYKGGVAIITKDDWKYPLPRQIDDRLYLYQGFKDIENFGKKLPKLNHYAIFEAWYNYIDGEIKLFESKGLRNSIVFDYPLIMSKDEELPREVCGMIDGYLYDDIRQLLYVAIFEWGATDADGIIGVYLMPVYCGATKERFKKQHIAYYSITNTRDRSAIEIIRKDVIEKDPDKIFVIKPGQLPGMKAGSKEGWYQNPNNYGELCLYNICNIYNMKRALFISVYCDLNSRFSVEYTGPMSLPKDPDFIKDEKVRGMDQVTNIPLTVEELYKMNGNIVWDSRIEEYATVDVKGYNGRGCVSYSSRHIPQFLSNGRFYRHKPN